MKSILWQSLPVAILAVVFPAAAFAGGTSAAPSADIEAKIHYCKDCHGQNGQGFPGVYPVPRLAGQTIDYLQAKFTAITEHNRDNVTAETFMAPALGSVDPAIRLAVAKHFNGLDPEPVGGPKDDGTGQKIYERGVPEAGVPACNGCHGPDAKGAGVYPRIAGQLYPYTVKVLSNWVIINKELATSSVKSPVEHKLTLPQITAVAAYLSNLGSH